MTTVETPDLPPDLGIPGTRERQPSVFAAHRRTVLAAVTAVAVVFDLVWHVGGDTVSGAVLALALAGLAAFGRGRPRPATLAAAGLLAVIGAGTAVRTQGWVVVTDWAVVFAALPVVAGLAGGVSLRDLAPTRAVVLVSRCAAGALVAPVELARLLARPGATRAGRDPDRWARILLGLVLATPVVLIVGALLASADAVFASFLHLPFDPVVVVNHGFVLAFGSMVALALLLSTRLAPREPSTSTTRPLGHVEITVVLSGLVVVLGLFGGAQSVALVRGGEYVERSTGLTYSDYARGGFFQLLWVAAIAGAVLAAVVPVARAAEGRGRVRSIVLGELGVVLTLVVVAVAIRRLDLYQSAYGLTMLRLACTWAAILLGVGFVVIGLAIAGVGRSHRWLTGALVGVVLLGVAAANVADPAAIVARANVDRSTVAEWGWYEPTIGPAPSIGASDGLDIVYLLSLGDDAVPVLLEHLDDMPAPVAEQVVRDVCVARPEARSILDANLSASRAESARREHCPPERS